MKTLGFMRVAIVAALVIGSAAGAAALLTSCGTPPPPPRPVVQPGVVPNDLVTESLGRTIRAATPVYYTMPIDDALAVLGPPQGELRDLVILRRFARTRGARAYYWQTRSTTLYVVFDRRAKLVLNVVVVDDSTDSGTEVLVTREEVLSMQIKPGMSVGHVLRVMGPPTRFEEERRADGRQIDRLVYESADDIAPPVTIDVDHDALTVISVSTVPTEPLGPEGLE
jgi:hypothetical protein